VDADWLNERAVVITLSVAEILKKHGPDLELDQILFDSLRIYSTSYIATPNTTAEAALLNMDRPLRAENLGQVKKAMALIKAQPHNVVSVLEKFATL